MRLEPERRWPQRCLGWASNLASNLAARGHVLSDWGCNQVRALHQQCTYPYMYQVIATFLFISTPARTAPAIR